MDTHYSASERHAKLLESLGVAVRAARSELGLTMKALATRAQVSMRFLVQLEAGEGNISVARLEDVAEALGTTGAELLARAARPVAHEGARTIALVGLRGAGKSSIGAAVAKRLHLPFVELDEAIVREAQMTLGAIFEIHGEAWYRNVERTVLRRILDQKKPVVLATGGSIVTDAETWGLLRSRAKTIWLKASPEEHWNRVVAQGDVRPMRGRPQARSELAKLLASRTPLYEQAGATIETSKKSASTVVDAVIAHSQA